MAIKEFRGERYNDKYFHVVNNKVVALPSPKSQESINKNKNKYKRPIKYRKNKSLSL